jgi:hypothetical protein
MIHSHAWKYHRSNCSKGLSGGTKAGITVGIVVFVIAIILVAFCYFRRRGKFANRALREKPLKSKTHELITTANTHQMNRKHNIPKMDEQNSSKLKPAFVAIEGRGQEENVHELGPASHVTSLSSNEMLESPQELENLAAQSLVGISASAGKQVSNTIEPRSMASISIVESELAGLDRQQTMKKRSRN